MTQSQHSQASRAALTDLIIDTKIRKNLTFEAIADGTGLSLAFVTAALLGQHPLPADAAKVVADKLELGEDAVRQLQTIPVRGSIPGGGFCRKFFNGLNLVRKMELAYPANE
jgi:cyanate lyase